MFARPFPLWSACVVSLFLAACGGGGDGGPAPAVATQPATTTDPTAPALTGNTATDALNRFNWRRQQAGLLPVTVNASITTAAQAHSDYQRLNNTITHVEDSTKPGFTGASPFDRMQAAGYTFSATSGYLYGEVIASQVSTQGTQAADDLMAAIYHRFIILEPMFKDAGAGAGTGSGGLTYVTVDFAANGFDRTLPKGSVVTYPFAGQNDVPTSFDSDQESPDPVPNQNRVGYPVSVHAGLSSKVTVLAFTITPRGGSALTTRLLTKATDADTPDSAAAAIPLSTLAAGTTYDVQFTGAVDGVPVTRNWSFSTR
jgi:uncharacterized protein YkwD